LKLEQDNKYLPSCRDDADNDDNTKSHSGEIGEGVTSRGEDLKKTRSLTEEVVFVAKKNRLFLLQLL